MDYPKCTNCHHRFAAHTPEGCVALIDSGHRCGCMVYTDQATPVTAEFVDPSKDPGERSNLESNFSAGYVLRGVVDSVSRIEAEVNRQGEVQKQIERKIDELLSRTSV